MISATQETTGLVRRLTGLLLCALVAGVLSAAGPAGAAVAAGAGRAMVNDAGCSTHRLARNDDESSARVSLPFRLNFYGRYYSSLHVNNNGNVTFSQPLSTFTPFRITASTPPIIAPFLADVDTRPATSGVTTYGVTTYGGRPAFCVTWRRVGYFSQATDKTNSFQLLLVNTSSSGDFDIVFNYDTVTWETGSASNGSGGFGGTSAGAGFSNGDNDPTHFRQLTGSLVPGALLDRSPTGLARTSNVSPAVPGRWVFNISSGAAVSSSSTCKDHYFVSVRGSGETSRGTSDTTASAPILPVWRSFRNTFEIERGTGSVARLGFHQLDYEALPVSVLMDRLFLLSAIPLTGPALAASQMLQVNLPRYAGSVQDGVTALIVFMNKANRACATQNRRPDFVLVGYSQGALAIHEFLRTIPSALAPQVRGVGLVADPARVPHAQEYVSWGDAGAAGQGICGVASGVASPDPCGGSTGVDIPSRFRSVTQSLCVRGDVVCDTTGVTNVAAVPLAAHGVRLHTSLDEARAPELDRMGRGLFLRSGMS